MAQLRGRNEAESPLARLNYDLYHTMVALETANGLVRVLRTKEVTDVI
jgi:hypothetical protein